MPKNTENELEILRKKAADLESKLAAQDIEIRRHIDEKMMMDLAIQKVVQESEQRHQESIQRYQLIETQLQARLKKKKTIMIDWFKSTWSQSDGRLDD